MMKTVKYAVKHIDGRYYSHFGMGTGKWDTLHGAKLFHNETQAQNKSHEIEGTEVVPIVLLDRGNS